MPKLLRMATPWRWAEVEDETERLGDFPADPLYDFRTSGNMLSVWYIEDEQAGLQRVVAALAAARNKLDNLDYLVFDQELLDEIGIAFQSSKGDTPDEDLNLSCHRDLIDLSAEKLKNLAKIVPLNDVDRFPKKEVAQMLVWTLELRRNIWTRTKSMIKS